MIIHQEVLFSFEELQKCEPKSRIEILMDNLDVPPCVQKLPVHTLGRRPYPHAAMVRALVAMRLLSIPTVSALIERLSYDIRFRHACGFDAAPRAPAGSKFSQFHKMLSENDGLHRLFDALVQQCRNLGIADGETVAIDSSALHAYGIPCPKASTRKTASKPIEATRRIPTGIPRTGKLHTAVDAKSGLPLAMQKRLFSREKISLGLDNTRLRGIAKVTAHSLLCGITVLASAIALH